MVTYNQGIVWYQSLIHPLERESTSSLQENLLLISLSEDLANLKLQVENSAAMKLNNFLVTESTYPKLYAQYLKVLEMVGSLFSNDTILNQKYPLFIVQDYQIKSDVFGSDRNGYYIQITSGAVESLTDSEMRALLGQSVAHIRAGHVQFIELLRLMKSATLKIPVIGNICAHMVWSQFAHWQLFSDYSVDRIGAVCAGSVSAAMSLLAKQVGCSENPYELITGINEISELPMSGIFFVWMMQQMPVCNAMGRMKELSEWSKSSDFRQKYPFMYYCAKVDRGDSPMDDLEKKVMKLHSDALTGNPDSAAILGESYLRGFNNLPESLPLGISLISYAALHGNGGAMYILYHAASANIPGTNFNPMLRNQLLLSARSRGQQDIPEADSILPKKRIAKLNVIIRSVYTKECKYIVNVDSIGDPILSSDMSLLSNRFLLEADEPILAYECLRIDGEYYGTVLTPFGFYSMIEGKRYPQPFGWDDFKNDVLQSVMEKGREYLRSGSRNVYQFHDSSDELKGTMGELIVTIKSILSNKK